MTKVDLNVPHVPEVLGINDQSAHHCLYEYRDY